MNQPEPLRHLRPLGTIRFCAATAILLCIATDTLAQTPAAESHPATTISGTVRDPVGSLIANATIFLEEKAANASVETKTKDDGTFSFLLRRPGSYVVHARMRGFREAITGPCELSLGQKKQIDFVLHVGTGGGVIPDAPPPPETSACPSANLELSDQPSFSIAGITDWTNVGGHGSDTKLRTSESLAKETAALKSTWPAETLAPAAVSPGPADAHRLAGDRSERSGDPLAAEREYEEAVRLDPSDENYFAWGTELLIHRAIKPAAEVFTKGAAAHPQSARMLAGLGAALYAGGDYADAARRVCEASDRAPADPIPYLFLGKMEKAAPDPLPCAAEKLARFVREQPANPLANYYYAVSLWKTGRGIENSANLRQAETLLQKAVDADPKLDQAYVQLGSVFAERGMSSQAIGAYKKAVAVNPQSGEAHYRLALAYKRAGDNEKSEQELRLYKQADQTETAAIEQQRREIRQFLIILKDQPQLAPH